MSAQHRLVFLPGTTITLSFRFDSACVGVTCRGDTTCADGVCVDDFVPSCLLEGARPRGFCARDAGVDLASMDARPADATPDLGASDVGLVDAPEDPPDADSADGGSDECAVDAECDDGDACTVDVCEGGACDHRSVVCPDDGRSCTRAICDPLTGCLDVALDDGAMCGTGGTCCAGTCVTTATDPTHCGDCSTTCSAPTPACIEGACGRCTSDGDCRDGALSCQTATCVGDACQLSVAPGVCLIDGACRAGGDRSPTNDCLECDPSRDPTRWSDRMGSCDDDDACTLMDVCAAGACTGRTRTCSDGLSCTADSCDASTGCVSMLMPGRCLITGSCLADGAPNPMMPCEACDSAANPMGWSVSATGMCDDGLFCTSGESCSAGMCGGGAARDCADALACTTDSCSESGDRCDHPLVAGTCLIAGACYAEAEINPTNQCQYCATPLSSVAWSSRVAQPCDDGLYCTVNDACTFDGDCLDTDLRMCSDGLSCTDDSCNEAMDRCDNVIAAGTCLIAGACRMADEPNPANWCQQCLPAVSQTTWSSRVCPDVCCDTTMACVASGFPCP